MSYSISLWMTVDTGGTEPAEIHLADVGGYTTNVAPMWSTALGHSLAELKDRTAGDCLDTLTRAIAAMENDPETYRAMNPRNGWGNYEGALHYLRRLRDACAAHPKASIYISH